MSKIESIPFSETTRRWFETHFPAPTEVQRRGWLPISQGCHSLLLAPTGSGKTLAAFLWAIDQLVSSPASGGTRTVYVSPLKALVYDVERNLRAPLAGVTRAADLSGARLTVPEVAVRTGDTSARERERQLRQPGDILVTTPESLYLMLGSRHRRNLSSVQTVIIDEIHALAGTKRGAHLALSLERLAGITRVDPQRIGLSATVRPVTDVARYLGGDRPVEVVDTVEPPRIDLRIVVPVEDMDNPPPAPPREDQGGAILAQLSEQERTPSRPSLWTSLYPKFLDLIQEHRSVIFFVNSRGLCERLALKINELAEEELVLAHHGSVSHEKRRQMEELLKSGRLRAIVATSSLELGIDMGAVDLVVMVESPGSVARGLQRVGRAGHQVGEVSKGKLFPKFRGDLLECAVVSARMEEGAIEPVQVPRNPLDVLAQQIVAEVSVQPLSVSALKTMVRRTASFSELGDDLLIALLDMLSGRFPSTEFAELKGRLNWDREQDVLEGRPGSKMLTLVNAGTIPDRGLYAVYAGDDGPRLGELDEEMVHEMRPGQNFLLGASTWRVLEITRDRVIVSPAPGEPGQLPFWHGEGPGRPVELGKAIGAYLRGLDEKSPKARTAWLEEHSRLDAYARKNLCDYLQEQKTFTERLPTDRTIVVERFRDELGDWRVCILSPFGSRVHAPWALAIEARLGEKAGFEIQTLYSDDGISLRMAEAEEPPELDCLFPRSEEIRELVIGQLGNSAVFASTFRENAARALLLPRRHPGRRSPLWAQRLKAQNLLAVARNYPDFPIILETYRHCLQDIFDVPSLKELLQLIERRQIKVHQVETESASPFARSLVFAYVAEYLYQGDSPLAERKAQALTLDRNLLNELLGQEELRELLDATVIQEVEEELQGLAPQRQAGDLEQLVDLLRRVGELSPSEIASRCRTSPQPMLRKLLEERRVVAMMIGGEERYLVVEDAALYRDALGAMPPKGLPTALLEPVERPLEQVFARYARTRGPFEPAALARRYGMTPAQCEPTLRVLCARNRLLEGGFLPHGCQREFCDPEVLRSIRRRTLAKLRNAVAPVEAAGLCRFLLDWHGVVDGTHLEDAITQLEGLPISFQDLEKSVLPQRVRGYRPDQLDRLCQSGALVWVGCGSLGSKDGKIALFRRDRISTLLSPPERPEELEPLQQRVLEVLEQRGACFFYDLLQLCGQPRSTELLSTLWDLVWMGLLTNDSFAPLRSLGAPRRGRRSTPLESGSGRWVMVSSLLYGEPSDTERLMAWSNVLLERYGVVSRDAVVSEGLPGGFAPLYQTYKALEETGRVRRGYFVEGLSGAQFAWAHTVDRLRAEPPAGIEQALVLSTPDPANPYGSLLPWPENGGRPRRASGSKVILVQGFPVFFLEKGGKKLTSFPQAEDPSLLQASLAGLRELARQKRGRSLKIQEIDGAPARKSPLAPRLLAAGFREDPQGLVLLEGLQ
ncbi:MAG: DEAD/DEAH box helicase [Vulcanimicrobiota bacterium]